MIGCGIDLLAGHGPLPKRMAGGPSGLFDKIHSGKRLCAVALIGCGRMRRTCRAGSRDSRNVVSIGAVMEALPPVLAAAARMLAAGPMILVAMAAAVVG